MLSLIAWVAAYTHVPLTLDMVSVRNIPHAELAQAVCNRPCPVIGWTKPEKSPVVIYIDDEHKDDRRIVVHELVHATQVITDKYDMRDCGQAIRAELDAYAAQNAYAEQYGLQITGPHPAECSQ